MEGRSILLSSGHKMPLLGLGCWQSSIDELPSVVEIALDAGYRHIDSAYQYQNEEGVGNGLQKWLKKTGKKRSEIFVVTKLPMVGMHTGRVETFMKKSLKNLQLDYVDLYLIHLPVGLKFLSETDVFPMDENNKPMIDMATDLIAVWKEMEKMVDMGLAKSIGLSNFNIKQIKKICANARIQPAVHQVEQHVFFQQFPMQEFCKSKNIAITAYSPLGSPGRPAKYSSWGSMCPGLLEDPVVNLVAERHNVTTAQILLRYLVQQDISTIPKSTQPQRIKTNGDIWGFHLSESEMAALRSLDKGETGRTFLAIPGFEEHPESPW